MKRLLIALLFPAAAFAQDTTINYKGQPPPTAMAIKAMAPIDQAYTKMLNDIVLLIVGGIGGIMGKRAVSAAAHAIVPDQPKGEPDEPK